MPRMRTRREVEEALEKITNTNITPLSIEQMHKKWAAEAALNWVLGEKLERKSDKDIIDMLGDLNK